MAEEAIKALEIAPASIWRLTQSGVVLFLLQMALSVVLGMVVLLPTMALIFIPTIRAVEAGMLPSPESAFAMFPAYFLGMLVADVLATALALGFIVGKKWGGARLAFVYE